MTMRRRILRRGAFVGLAVAAAAAAAAAQPSATLASARPAAAVAAPNTAGLLPSCTYIGPNPAIGFAGLVCTGVGGHGFVIVFTFPLPTFAVF